MQITCAVHVRASRPVRCDPWAIELLMPAMDKGNMSHDTLDASYAAHVRTMIRYHHDHAIPPGHGIVMLNVQAAWVPPKTGANYTVPCFLAPGLHDP